jgi:8-oxo-dGTP pyrophosphatase MutT (NUDIX family)
MDAMAEPPEPADPTGPSPDTTRPRRDPAARGNPWRRHARRVAYANPWLTVWHDEVTRPDGLPGIYGVVHLANLAVGVVVRDGDRVLLVGQYRYTLDRYSWEIPEGGVPPAEDALAGAQREVAEETGYRAAHWRELLRVHTSNSVTDETAVLFEATGLTPGPASPEGTEALSLRWVTLDEALGLIAQGELTDAMSVLALQALALERADHTA